MKVAIHQPEHLPWLGFFHKMAKCDLYVILDSVQFTKNNYQNRNRLVDRDGSVYWSTVPVQMAGHTSRTLCETLIDNAQPWKRKCWSRMAAAYGHHAHFRSIRADLESIYAAEYETLVPLNMVLIEFFRRQLGIDVPMVRSSSLSVNGTRSSLLLAICQSVGATTYLSGPSGRDYLDGALFASAGIDVEYHAFTHPTYAAPTFVPYLSTLDLLANHGPDSARLLGLTP